MKTTIEAHQASYVGKLTKTREDIKTWSDLLELDDFVSFGGKA